jgi:hypothetical protein
MATEFYNLVGQAGTYNSTGPKIDLDGAAKDDRVTFGTNVTDAATVRVMIKKDATNLLVWEATFADLATDTLTRVTELTAIGTISNTDAVDCYLVNDADIIKRNYEESKGHIHGLELDYNAGTLKCKEGHAVVNGELLEVAGAGTTTISGDALTSAVNIFYIYIYDNAGTVQMHREKRVTGADDPIFDFDIDYAKHPVDGAAKRCIGAIFVGQTTAGVMDAFEYKVVGRLRTYHPEGLIKRVVSAGTATTATSVDCSAYMPALSIAFKVGFKLHTKNASVGSTSRIYTSWAPTSAMCTAVTGLQVSAQMDNASTAAALGPIPFPVTQTTFYYLVNPSGGHAFVDICNWEMQV